MYWKCLHKEHNKEKINIYICNIQETIILNAINIQKLMFFI